MTVRKVGSLISQITLQTLGVAVSPHLFRTAGATTATFAACTKMPHLASALLNHRDRRVTEQSYIRNTSVRAAQKYAAIIRKRRPNSG
jgi:integrase